jgi:hypothetical protein
VNGARGGGRLEVISTEGAGAVDRRGGVHRREGVRGSGAGQGNDAAQGAAKSEKTSCKGVRKGEVAKGAESSPGIGESRGERTSGMTDTGDGGMLEGIKVEVERGPDDTVVEERKGGADGEEADLPAGWSAHVDENRGLIYYFNAATGGFCEDSFPGRCIWKQRGAERGNDRQQDREIRRGCRMGKCGFAPCHASDTSETLQIVARAKRTFLKNRYLAMGSAPAC